MKLTLLDIVQDVLSDMDSDEVNSINDTFESSQVAQIVKTTFFEMIANRNWPHLNKLIQLEASGDSAKPTKMRVSENVKEVRFIKYDKRKVGESRRRYQSVDYVTPEEFLRKIEGRNNDDSNMLLVEEGVVEYTVRTDVPPTFYTSFDDEFVSFDSYDSEVDTTLQSSKTQVQAYVTPDWSSVDSFIPDLPEEAFSALLAESKSVSFNALKQMTNFKAEQQSKRQNQWLSRKAWKVAEEPVYPNFGRTSMKGAGRWKFDKDN